MREPLKAAARGLAFVLVLPVLGSYAIRRRILGPDRALVGSAQALALVPGLPGGYLRRAFLSRVLAEDEMAQEIVRMLAEDEFVVRS